MAWRIVKQPNGRYARFSDMANNFTNNNHSWDDIFPICVATSGSATATKKMRAADEDWLDNIGLIRGNGLERWKAALETIKRVHGVREMNRVIKLDEEIA